MALNEDHFKDILFACATPFPLSSAKSSWKSLRMGFPKKKRTELPSLCSCHGWLTLEGFICPACHSKCCHLPGDCTVCGLTLVSSPHLARSYHHLFPIPDFISTENDMQATARYELVLRAISCATHISSILARPVVLLARTESLFCSSARFAQSTIVRRATNSFTSLYMFVQAVLAGSSDR